MLQLLLFTAVFYAGSVKALRGLYIYPWQAPGVALRLTACVLLTIAKYIARGGKPQFPEWTLEAEISQAILRTCSTHYPARIVQPTNAEYLRIMLEKWTKSSSRKLARGAGVAVHHFSFNGLEHIWLRPRESQNQDLKRFVVLYFHGGGFVMGCPGVYITATGPLQRRIHAQLARALGEDVRVDLLLANYRKAPKFPYPRPPQDAYAMYKYLLNEEKLSPSQILVMGDSAGGGLTMTTLLRAKEENPELLPAAAILSSPFVDREIKSDDRDSPYCLFTAHGVQTFWKAYHSGEGDPSSWGDASPVHCDLSGLPPVYIQATAFDHILPHSKRLFEKAVSDGLEHWTLDIIPNVPHAYTSLPNPWAWPTAGESLDKMSQFAAAQFVRAGDLHSDKPPASAKAAAIA